MTESYIRYDKEKFTALLHENYCKRVGLIPGTSKSAEELCTRLAEWLYGRRRRNSLLIKGGVGTGKTTLVEALYDTLRTLTDHDVWTAIKMRVKAYQLNDEDKLQNGLIDLLSESKGLIIDDLGSESPIVKIYGSEIHPMEQVVKRRSDAQLPTIATTNLSLDAVEKQYNSHRMADVLAEYDQMIVNGNSFRRL